MDTAQELLKIVISWPMAVIIALLILREPIRRVIQRLVQSDSGKAKLGPVEIELGKIAEDGRQAVDQLHRLNVLMAETRLLELEITEGNFGPMFSEEQREKMQQQINELRLLMNDR